MVDWEWPGKQGAPAGLTDYAPEDVRPATERLPEEASEAADRAQRALDE